MQPLRKRRPYVSWNWLGNDQVEIGAQTWRLIHPAELKHELLKSRPFTRRCPCEFTCRDCEKISQAPAPFHVIARGWAGPSLLAMILFEKYWD